MKILLAAINAKYIHSNLGIYSLRAYAKERLYGLPVEVELGEYTINHTIDGILRDIYRREPDVVGFSCYIWNISMVKTLVRDLRKILPGVRIWLGGPEASYDAARILTELPEADLVMVGEGEETFARLCESAAVSREKIPGLAFWEDGGNGTGGKREGKGKGIVFTEPARLLDLDEIPFPYGDLEGMEHRILYYESSRGCPFSCSYCLSSIEKQVRFRSFDKVRAELDFFLARRVPQVKFVDRTFNCRRSHALAIWRYLLEHDNGYTNFHFEIAADLLGEEELAIMKQMRPGLIQLEIGVQTTNPETIREIRRTMDLKRVEANVARVNGFANIHQHLDLIAGLPLEDLESFRRSFDRVYRMRPEQLQLGFLKVLKGSYMEEQAKNYGLSFGAEPPYEVLSTRWLTYGDLLTLKGVEEMVEVYYNSGQFRTVMAALEAWFRSPFSMYEALAAYYEREGLTGVSHSRLARYEILHSFLEETVLTGLIQAAGNGAEASGKPLSSPPQSAQTMDDFRDLLMYDLYLRENVKSRPSFAPDLSPHRARIRDFFRREEREHRYLTGYEGYDSRQMARMAHLEAMADGSFVLFDYRNRDALLGNARAIRLSAAEVDAGDETANQ